MKRSEIGKLLMVGGLLLIVSAFSLILYNNWESMQAGKNASQILEKVQGQVPSSPTGLDAQYPEQVKAETKLDTEMPTVEVNGQNYIGTIQIPDFGINLPILTQWDYELAKTAPCRYKGSVYDGALIIAGHSYKTHFGCLSSLRIGQTVRFIDVNGNEFPYSVSGIEVIDKTDISKMEAGDWDLTLFSCTPGGKQRVTIRCVSAW